MSRTVLLCILVSAVMAVLAVELHAASGCNGEAAQHLAECSR